MGFLRAQRGGLGLIFAMTAPVLLVVSGVAIDYASASMLRTKLQAIADSAAIAGAKQFSLANSDAKTVNAVVDSFIGGQAEDNFGTVQHRVKIDKDANEVRVEIEQIWRPVFSHLLDSEITPIRIHSVARLVDGAEKICVLSLEPFALFAVYLKQSATLTAKGCGVYVNSISPWAFALEKDATMSASLICAAGGVQLMSSGSAKPQPLSDCPQVADPLAGRPAPTFAGCTATNLVIDTGDVTLNPGVYCGGIKITGKSKVLFNEGNYVIKDGKFKIDGEAEVTADHAGFYLTGANSLIEFAGDATIDFKGPRAGPLAGLLFFEDRNAPGMRFHRISATNANRLEGTIYLPKGILQIDPNSKVAEKSAYTAIVALSLVLDFGPELILNADYDATDVPVPEGIKGESAVMLSN
jgi:Putative Flp pilus-assembly TadE/G-like